MGNPVVLTDSQKKLRERLIALNKKAWDCVNNRSRTFVEQLEIDGIFFDMAKVAHELHMSLRASGIEPKHHKYMIENRGVPVEDIEFYKHVHPVDDLLKFIDDSDANNDPEDTTIGKKFTLRVYTRRWGHYDHYILKRTTDGWELEGTMVANSGRCDKKCEPFLSKTLEHDCVCYPHQIGEFMEYLWEQAAEGLTVEKVRECIDMLGEWISCCEMNAPRGVFEGLI